MNNYRSWYYWTVWSDSPFPGHFYWCCEWSLIRLRWNSINQWPL